MTSENGKDMKIVFRACRWRWICVVDYGFLGGGFDYSS